MADTITITTGYLRDGDGRDNVVQMDADAARGAIRTLLHASGLGGWTLTEGEGGWTNDAGFLIVEPVFVITSHVAEVHNGDVKTLCADLCRALGQMCVTLQVSQGTAVQFVNIARVGSPL